MGQGKCPRFHGEKVHFLLMSASGARIVSQPQQRQTRAVDGDWAGDHAFPGLKVFVKRWQDLTFDLV